MPLLQEGLEKDAHQPTSFGSTGEQEFAVDSFSNFGDAGGQGVAHFGALCGGGGGGGFFFLFLFLVVVLEELVKVVSLALGSFFLSQLDEPQASEALTVSFGKESDWLVAADELSFDFLVEGSVDWSILVGIGICFCIIIVIVVVVACFKLFQFLSQFGLQATEC